MEVSKLPENLQYVTKKNAEVTETEKKHIEGPLQKNVLKVLFDIIRANKLQPMACSANRTTLISTKQNTPTGWRTTDPSKLVPFYANYIGISYTSTCLFIYLFIKHAPSPGSDTTYYNVTSY
jgi:hypothetical protein